MKKLILGCLLLSAAAVSDAQTKITPDDAAKHIGDSVSVCGKVFGGKWLEQSKGQPTLLNMGAAFPNSPFTVVLFPAARQMFKEAPEVFYTNKEVCVLGTIKDYKGKPQIEVTNPDQISEVKQ
ncbi:MAG: hypothetical protein ABIX01_05820 [Chitinophagaceae bacterium]